MKRSIRKALVFVSLALYLAASSAASLHALPMAQGESNQKMSMIEASPSSHCHTVGSENPELVDDSLTCEVFCSVMAQAISLDYQPLMASLIQPPNNIPLLSSHISFPHEVEPHPPKFIS